MAIALTLDGSVLPQGSDTTGREQFYIGTLTFSGSYVTGGDTLSFNVAGIVSNAAPTRVEVYEEPKTTQTATGYNFIYAKGTTSANGAVQIFSPGSATGTISSVINAPTGSVTNALGVAAGALTSTSGATGVTGVVSTFTGTGGSLTQFAAGAYSTTFATTTVKVRAWFPRGQ